MNKLTMVLLLIFSFILIVLFTRNSALLLGFDGEVESINWKSKNHGWPLIRIKEVNNRIVDFNHFKIILKAEDISVGDKIKKIEGEDMCLINNIKKKCLE